MEREEQRTGRSPGESFVAVLRLDELDRYRDRMAPEVLQGVWEQVAQLAAAEALADEKLAHGEQGDLLLLLPAASLKAVTRRLNVLSARIANHRFDISGQFSQFSPVLGYATLRKSVDERQPIGNARDAAAQSHLHLDLKPVLHRAGAKPPGTGWPGIGRIMPAWLRDLWARHALVCQYVITMFLGLGLPFLVYWGLCCSSASAATWPPTCCRRCLRPATPCASVPPPMSR